MSRRAAGRLNENDDHTRRGAMRDSRRALSRIGPRLFAAVMVPVVALSALGLAGVAQRYRDAGAVAAIETQVRQVAGTLNLYAGLVDESSGSESIVVTSALGISTDEASKLTGYDIAAQLRKGRSEVDAALTNDDDKTILGNKTTQLVALRARIDTGSATESEVRAFFLSSVAVAATAWNADLAKLNQLSLSTAGSPELQRAVAGLTDSVTAFIAGSDASAAAGKLTVPGVLGKTTAFVDLAVANALYRRTATRLGTELRGQAAATQDRLVVTDDAAQAFLKFVGALIASSPGAVPTLSISELGRVFGNGLHFVNRLGQVVRAAAAEITPLVHGLQASAQRALVLYLLALGIIAAFSAAVAIVTARNLVRPLGRLAARARKVSSGTLDDDVIEPDGPYEIAMATAAFNEVVANLSALDASTLALASGDLDNAALLTAVPGRIGESMRHSVERLHDSIRTNEALRQTLALSEIRFRELADRSPDIVIHLSREPELHIDYVSPSAELLTGMAAATVEADLRVFAGMLDHDSRVILADAASGRALPPRFDTTVRRADGTNAVFEVRVVETTDGIQAVGRDVTEIRALQAQLAEQATRDPLTGLANRRLLDELLHRAISRTGRTGNTLTVAFLDLDNFKSVNDTYGHEAGDAVLRATAARLQAAVRDADGVARYGGDEFVVVYEGAGNAAQQLTQRIADALDPPIDVGNGTAVQCRPSIGISDTRTTAPNPAALINTADRNMLETKKTRKSTRGVLIAHPDIDDAPLLERANNARWLGRPAAESRGPQ